jgi:Primosomal protein N'' (replication factor Y) - superfamily II helicase
MPKQCPKCTSKLIGGYGTGTEKVEAEVKKLFSDIRTLRMDKDTTQAKGSHGRIIDAFRNHKADCLIGTQMIVKGHDFGNVTVVGAILADLGLFDTDYESAERTFDLLTQAAGRAGRADKKGYAVIQTYQPEHYAIVTASEQNYEGFYGYETAYRRMLRYPPFYQLTGVLLTSADEEAALNAAEDLAKDLKIQFTGNYNQNTENILSGNLEENDNISEQNKKSESADVIGPAEAVIYRIDEIYRRVIYIKSESIELTRRISDYLQTKLNDYENVTLQVDLNPLRMV